jgi:hypothetical protein
MSPDTSTDEAAPTAHEAVEEEEWLEDPDALELPRRPRRRLLTPVPLTLIGVLLIVCGFIGGVLVEKGQTSSSSGSSAGGGALAARFAALRGGAGATGSTNSGGSASGSSAGSLAGSRFGGAASAGRPTVGQVAYIDGSTLYVENAEGNTVKVTTSPGSTVSKTVTSSVKGIHPGETVVIQGSTSGNGTVAASSISIGGATGGFGGLFGGAGGGAGRAARDGGGAGSSGGPALFGG